MRITAGLFGGLVALALVAGACGDPESRWAQSTEGVQRDRTEIADEDVVRWARGRIDDDAVIYSPPPQLPRDLDPGMDPGMGPDPEPDPDPDH